MKKGLFLLYLSFVTLSVAAVEVVPGQWWAGMKNTELQLMISGDFVSQFDVRCLSPEVVIKRVERTANENHLFVYVDTKGLKPGKYTFELSKGRRRAERFDFVLNERKAGSAERSSFGTGDAIYLLMPDRFANGNAGNDNVEGYADRVDTTDLFRRQGGDLQGMIDHLDYIADLGMTAIWATPIFDDNDDKATYHHYAATDLYKVDPRFGSNEDFCRLVEECHKHGLKFIMDIVPNHINPKYAWGEGLPDSAWYHRWDEFTRTNYQTSAQTDIYASQADKKELAHGWFDVNMADVNLSDQKMFDYLRQVYVYWIELTGLDGLRVDTYPYNDLGDASRLMAAIREEYPNINIVGECWAKTVPELAYYQSGSKTFDGFDSNLPSIFDFLLVDCLTSAFNEAEGWNTGLIRFYAHYAQDFAYARPDQIISMLDNHDLPRFANFVDYDVRKYKMGLALIAVTRGMPQYYYGDEIMIWTPMGAYENCRPRFPGGWEGDARNAFTAEGRTEVENDVYDYLRTVLQFRKGSKAITEGRMMQFIPRDGIYCFFRYTDDEMVMVVVNNNEEAKEVDMRRFDEMSVIGRTVRDVVSGSRFTLGDKQVFEGKRVTILEVEE